MAAARRSSTSTPNAQAKSRYWRGLAQKLARKVFQGKGSVLRGGGGRARDDQDTEEGGAGAERVGEPGDCGDVRGHTGMAPNAPMPLMMPREVDLEPGSTSAARLAGRTAQTPP